MGKWETTVERGSPVGMAHWETTRLAKAHARRGPIFAKALHVGYGRRNIVCEGSSV